MQRMPSAGKSSRPKAPVSTKSFTRFEPQESHVEPRPRSSTDPELPVPPSPGSSANQQNDVYDNPEDSEDSDGGDQRSPLPADGPFGELPVEIQTLVENFLESLGAKVHPTPLSIDQLAELFQDFYQHTSEKIDAHMAMVAARSPSGQSNTPSVSSSGSAQAAAVTNKGAKPTTKSNGRSQPSSTDQQMLTPSEITGRRKARRYLEHKAVAMGEAVERSICEKVYPRIWRHRTTDDEERDEKLRSRAAALALVGVDLRELLSTAMGGDVGSASQLELNENDGVSARARLAGARQSLQSMNDDRFPLGKLAHLTAAHKNIVEALQGMFPSTSSADEVLPTLIFTIITSDPNSNHIVSNFNFIQRFRASTKIDGEAAYCLTNLEAAITFLETVDLSSLRSDEAPEGPARNSGQPPTPRIETPDPMYHGLPSDPASFQTSRTGRVPAVSPMTERPRGLSILTQTRHRPFEAQSGAVLKKADEAFDTIHGALDGSFKFLFGRLRERRLSSTPPNGDTLARVANPRTLEDAHKLVSSVAHPEDDVSIDGSSTAEQSDETVHQVSRDKGDDNAPRIFQIIGGKRSRRESIDSKGSAEIPTRKVSFAEASSPSTSNVPKPLPANLKISTTGAATSVSATTPSVLSNLTPASAALGAVESMRNLGTTLNPLRGLAGMGMMRGFGRTVSSSGSTPPVTTASLSSPLDQAGVEQAQQQQQQQQTKSKDSFSLSGVAPPVQKFVDCKDFRELNGFEVGLLLRDYQRLAGALRALKESERNG